MCDHMWRKRDTERERDRESEREIETVSTPPTQNLPCSILAGYLRVFFYKFAGHSKGQKLTVFYSFN